MNEHLLEYLQTKEEWWRSLTEAERKEFIFRFQNAVAGPAPEFVASVALRSTKMWSIERFNNTKGSNEMTIVVDNLNEVSYKASYLGIFSPGDNKK